jgi:hypothetical protein
MKQVKVKKIIIALLLVSATHIAMGSFTGKSERRISNLYSLKYFNKNFYRNTLHTSLRAGFEYKGVSFLNQRKDANGDIIVNSMMRFEKGNTTYIYPYTHKIVVHKFNTPAPPAAFR